MQTGKLPRIGITMGDPAGIGPELCLRLLADHETRRSCVPLIFGNARILRRLASALSFDLSVPSVLHDEWIATATDATGPMVVDIKMDHPDDVSPGQVDAATGLASYCFIEAAIESALSSRIAAVVTGPINKEALRAAGIGYPGHTEIFAEKTSAKRSCMMLTSDELSCSFVTTHIGYRGVPAALSTERILSVIELSERAMHSLRGRPVKLAVCGLNPHAGEHGLFGGGEEETIIVPAVEAARKRGIDVAGPLPPDTAFLPGRRASTDVFVCMYHDQGHIPLKALAFDKAVNVTLGLPIVRTSVDHGTALDIAWKGVANPSSLVEATRLAVRLAKSPARKGGSG